MWHTQSSLGKRLQPDVGRGHRAGPGTAPESDRALQNTGQGKGAQAIVKGLPPARPGASGT